MIPQEAIDVVKRFYEAIDWLIEHKAFRGRQTFCRKYNIDKRKFYLIEKKPEIHAFRVSWMVYLVRDYKISAKWLLTGKGGMTRKNTL